MTLSTPQRMPINKTLIQAVMLLLLVVLSLLFVVQKSFFPELPLISNHPADSYMQQVTTQWMDQQGNIAAEFQSPQMIHYPDDNTTHITDPHVIIHSPDAPPWDVSARFGKSYEHIEKIVLWDQVRCHQPANPVSVESTVLTQAITLFPKLKQVETPQPVTAFQLGNHMEAVGLQADLNKGTLNLLSHVKIDQGLTHLRANKVLLITKRHREARPPSLPHHKISS